ncbi:unnamed protein product [Prunus armeniaca]
MAKWYGLWRNLGAPYIWCPGPISMQELGPGLALARPHGSGPDEFWQGWKLGELVLGFFGVYRARLTLGPLVRGNLELELACHKCWFVSTALAPLGFGFRFWSRFCLC